MAAPKKPADCIKDMARNSTRRRITGRNAVLKNLFEYLTEQMNLRTDFLALCTEEGLVLDFSAPDFKEDISGRTISLDALRQYQDRLLFHDGLQYRIISANSPKLKPAIKRLQNSLEALLKIFDTSESGSRYLLDCLDSVRNAISIYDKEARLLFANHCFCNYFRIDNREAVIGLDIRDIMKSTGITVSSMEKNSRHLKMLDVLKNGEEALDWEVRIESKDMPNKARLASNDMYPVINQNGEVEAMVELARSHQQDMTRTRKIMGLSAEYSFDNIIGSSSTIREKIRLAKEYANNPFNFLITGESGVGKELFAQSIHNHSANKKGPFVALNCASIPDNLIESELFGYVGGAFTGASKNGQVGKFELADGGTLFLDEIGELPYHFQSKLLRVLETWMVTRVGSSREIPITVRVIAATNRNLDKMMAEGLFRQDLYYRLHVLNIEIPPLRERGEDILLLAANFLNQFVAPDSGAVKTLDAEAKSVLLEYDWPGNVRELRNVINRSAILSKEPTVTRDILETSIYSTGYALKPAADESPETRLNKKRAEVDISYANLLKEALDITNGNKKLAAEMLGVSRKTFYRMLEKYDR
jgi:transcriptional regulator with PAS, ATPase and Fis domain